MRIVNADGRVAFRVADGIVDVQTASSGLFNSAIDALYPRWDEFIGWARQYAGPATAPAPERSSLGPPVPRPQQIFAIGANYRSHAEEAGLEVPSQPMVFTKFPACITGPFATVELPAGQVDFEVELVVVIGRTAHRVAEEQAWSHVAGLTVGQDLSERVLQISPPLPQQFSLAKSFTGFGPIGPDLVTPDEFDDRDDIEISCELAGEQMQHARTSDFIFSVGFIIAYLSRVLPLLPGDLIFTGTPDGIGWARKPQRFIADGEQLTSRATGIGEMVTTFTARGGDA